MNYNTIVQNVIDEYKTTPVDMLGIGDATGEYSYLNCHKDSYIRTVRDVDNLYKNERTTRHILEIGSFLGPVSIALKRLGYSVSALDIPEFYKTSSLRVLYERNGIPFIGINLRHFALPYESDVFDCVIACEVVEHLNFNPLPALKEINRVLKTGGYIYIGMPNQASLVNRLKMLFGKSICNPIDYYFKQLDRSSNMIVGLHWREYTLSETIEMIERMGFATITKYYFTEGTRAQGIMGYARDILNMRFIKLLSRWYPPFRLYHVVIARKTVIPSYDFWLTEANT